MISWLLARVEIAGRLVGEDDGGRAHQRARDGDALLLAARQFRRGVMPAIGETHLRERLHAEPPPLGARHAAIDQRQFEILERRGALEAD